MQLKYKRRFKAITTMLSISKFTPVTIFHVCYYGGHWGLQMLPLWWGLLLVPGTIHTAKKSASLTKCSRLSSRCKHTCLCALVTIRNYLFCIQFSDLYTVNGQHICKYVAHVTRSSATAEITHIHGHYAIRGH